MTRVVHIDQSVPQHISIIADLSYGWQCLYEYVPHMQDEIKKDPKSALLLKAMFMKLSSIMDAPLVRIIQAGSPDLLSVSKYLSLIHISEPTRPY